MTFKARRNKLRDFLKKEGSDGCIIQDEVNLFYYTGKTLSAGRLIILQDRDFLFVDGRYFEACQKQRDLAVLPLNDKAFETEIAPNLSFMVDSDEISLSAFQDLTSLLERCHHSLKSKKGFLRKLRSVKEVAEISCLTEASKLGLLGFDLIKEELKEGVTEKKLASLLEIFWKTKGAEGAAFSPIIAFGKNSALPHYRAGDEKLKKGDIVLVDIGVTLDRYHSDMTRVIFFGDPDPKLLEIHSIVFEALQRAEDALSSGKKIDEIDQIARDYIGSKGYRDNFTHSLGHGIGLEVHEFPTLRASGASSGIILEEGMVITIEPGIYLPGIGGVRLEDTLVITKDGYKNLTNRPYAHFS